MSGTARDKAWLDAHLPHQGAMNLLASVERWDALSIDCRASGHRAPDNPLRRGGELPAASGIEYAAQAVAAHGALLAGEGAAPAPGYLASVRGVRFGARRLDDVRGDLAVHAQRIGGDALGLLYEFRVAGDGRDLASGRLAVMLEARP